MHHEMYKQVGHGINGKQGQGITGKTAYNTRTETNEEIGESKITNPYLAAHVTGLIRALLGELIASAGREWSVISATTDSIVTNCQISEMDLERADISVHDLRVAEELDGKPDTSPYRGILEQKFEATRLLPWRTRGIATLACEGKPKLAQSGMRSPYGVSANAWFVTTMMDRKRSTTYVSGEFMSFPQAHKISADHILRQVEKRCNFEYDFKRQPVTASRKYLAAPQLTETDDLRSVQHLSFNTVPWQSVEEFNTARAMFEDFRKRGGQLRLWSDWESWEEFQQGDQELARLGCVEAPTALSVRH